MHSTAASGLIKLDTNDITASIPQELQHYLVTAQKPHEIHRLVDREHDRRTRLLLRRFTNQIQYGCTNPCCNVPTCLSYRKRVSPGPVRPHTDLTARALAVKCLEQYATQGRDLARYPARDKGKRKQTSSSADGLCWDEPIVPWYSDPREYLARRDAGQRRSSDERKSSIRVPGEADKRSVKRFSSPSNTGFHKFAGPLDSHSVAQQTPSLIDANLPLQSSFEAEGNVQPEKREFPTRKSGNHTYVRGQLEEPHNKEPQNHKQSYDHGSFPQSLFRHPKLQLEDGPHHDQCVDTQVTEEEGERTQPSDAFEPCQGIKQNTSSVGLLRINDPVTTFGILPPTAIQWFKEKFVKYRDEGRPALEELRAFLDQCLYFVIGDPMRLLRSASTWVSFEDCKEQSNPPGSCDAPQLIVPTPDTVVKICDTIVQCLYDSDKSWHLAAYTLRALQACYTLPSHIKCSNNLFANTQRPYRFLSNTEIAHIVLVVLTMTPLARSSLAHLSKQMQEFHRINGANEHKGPNDTKLVAENRTANHRLCESLADLISHRIAIDSATKVLKTTAVELTYSHGIVSEIISLMQSSQDARNASAFCEYHARHMLLQMQMVVFYKWDRNPTVRRTGPVGGALEMLKGLFIRRRHLGLDQEIFCMECIPAALDEVEMPFEWLSFKPDATKMHILQFPFLFPPSTIVRYFRSLNLKIMKQSHEKAMAVYTNGRAQLFNPAWKVANIDEVLNLTRSHMARYFVMTIRRSDILEDAIGQIWQRERRELLRPLKVTLGKEEGENGLDHGGVQQEFFRLVFAQAFDPSYGMFDVDPTTRMTWFKPGTLEPMYKYEALGILMSLAIYNGVTVPITMPLVFYRKLLGMKVKSVDHVEDGWPELAQSFSQLLAWEEGDVEDVMALTYDFSYDVFGETVTTDMSKKRANSHLPTTLKKSPKGKERATSFATNGLKSTDVPIIPDSPANLNSYPEAQKSTSRTPVTNTNRESFVHAYIDHLTNKSIASQFHAFQKGLTTLLSPTALSLFTPSHLKLLFEGHPTSHPISIDAWRLATKYEDFLPDEPLITWFWDILEHDFSQLQMRKLLEFVTASDRLPVGGWDGVTFIVQRNGDGDERLPGSSTCYGRLLLPEYSCRAVLKERLVKAVEEGLGFGMI